MKNGDIVKFTSMLTEDYKLWFLPHEEELLAIKALLGKIATIIHVQTHYNDDGSKEYYLDVDFANGKIMRRVNSLCFETVEVDFEYI